MGFFEMAYLHFLTGPLQSHINIFLILFKSFEKLNNIQKTPPIFGQQRHKIQSTKATFGARTP
jgi:hypothetical protein